MHRLLLRQLKKVFPEGVPDDPKLQRLISLVDQGYDSMSEEMAITERSLDLSCDELSRRNDTLNLILDSLPDMSLWIDCEGLVRDIRSGSFDPPMISPRDNYQPLNELPFYLSSPDLQNFLADYQVCTSRSSDLALCYENKKYLARVQITAVSKSRWLLVFQDIYLRKRLEELQQQKLQQSKRSEKQLQDLVNGAPIGILICDTDLNIVMNNDFVCHLLGENRNSIQSAHPSDYVPVQHQQRFKRFLEHAKQNFAQGETSRIDISLVRKNGGELEVELALSQLCFEERPMMIMAITDISERKRLESQLRHLAETDPLTGAMNRRSFVDHANKSIRYALENDFPLSLLMLDIDHFKRINDTYGHACGDLVLQRLVSCLRENGRQGDILGRLGGEEFAFILPMTDDISAQQCADKFRLQAQQLIVPFEGRLVEVTISIGIHTQVDHQNGMSIDELLKQADRCLYEAKRLGRNRVVSSNRLPLNQSPEWGL